MIYSSTFRISKFWLACITAFSIFITNYCSINSEKYFGPDKVYYKAPVFSLNNTNVTFVGSKYVGTESTDQSAVVNLGKSIAVLCQADMINRKVTNSSIDGVVNIVFSDFTDEIGSGQRTVADLLANNLYYYSNNSRLNSEQGNLDITGFFNLGVYGTAKVNSLATNEFVIPAINSGDSARNNPDNRFINPMEAANRTFFEFLDSEVFTSFDAVVQLTQFFNWSLVANLFESNSYGYSRQRDTISYGITSNNPIFTCSFIIPNFDKEKDIESIILSTFCKCVTGKDTIQVILLWMTTTVGLAVIKLLREYCSGSDKWTFIITSDYQTPYDYTRVSSSNLQYTFLIRDNGPWDYQQYIEECEADASLAVKPLLTASIVEYYKLAYNCDITDNEPDLSQCPESLLNRTEFCKCTGNELNTDPYAVRIIVVIIMRLYSLIMGISFLIFIPLSLTLGDSVDSAVLRTVIDDEYLTIVILSALALLFIPKIWSIYSKKMRSRTRASN